MSRKCNKICLALPWFGKLPPYWGGYIESCADNSDIDFLIVTDQAVGAVPDNVRVISMSWNQIYQKFKTLFLNLGYNRFYLGHPYKLCDYKPTYGLLFQEYLKGYEYWGYIDCDLIWGNISKFLHRIQYWKYDRIYRCGHLSIYRNTPEINNIFYSDTEGCIPFKDIVETSYSMNFDECGINEYFVRNNRNFYSKGDEVTFYAYTDQFKWKNFRNPELGELFVKECDGSTWVYYMTSEDKFDKQEVCYVHFMTKKNIAIPPGIERPYCITRDGIFHFSESDIMNLFRRTISDKASEMAFKRQQVRAFRRESIKKMLREFNYNRFKTFKVLLNRIPSYFKYLGYKK